MTSHQPENTVPVYARRGNFAYPCEAMHKKEKRLDDFSHAGLRSGQLRRYVSSNGRLYFAFLVASREISELIAMGNNTHNDFEVVIVLQCISLAKPKFSYYFVDHDHRRVSNESILMNDKTDISSDTKRSVAGYWEHLVMFSTHHLCTPADYNLARTLLYGFQSQPSIASYTMRNDGISDEAEILYDLLSRFDPIKIDTHATLAIGGALLARPYGHHENEDHDDFDEDYGEEGVHPLVHSDLPETGALPDDFGSQGMQERQSFRS
ncbi:hypothetical protein RHS04_05162 [Rhizoctonia solani]|uniref:Uncharacterized protein n=1 Tax=Rhizoctonia solani TaxID=456999 RepID=A0A8H7LMV8_9AGAM|nr:hypothetical protein RHS04_05162 [Rhizoctonia solani]